MPKKQISVWGIHGGQTGDAESLFLKKNVVGIGWGKIGDASKIKPDRESFKAKVLAAYPDTKPGALTAIAGQLQQFVHEANIGDVVIFPSNDLQIHIGILQGESRFKPRLSEEYPNTRPVKWVEDHPRKDFSQGALHEIGSSSRFFKIKEHAGEFTAGFEGKKEEDKTSAYVVGEIEQATQDFVIGQLKTLDNNSFINFIAHLLEVMGYQTRRADYGYGAKVEIIAGRGELGLDPPLIKVQVRSEDKGFSSFPIERLHSYLDAMENGLFATLGHFDAYARNYARDKANLRLIGGIELVDLILKHYDELDARYKVLLPLKKVFIPVSIEEVD